MKYRIQHSGKSGQSQEGIETMEYFAQSQWHGKQNPISHTLSSTKKNKTPKVVQSIQNSPFCIDGWTDRLKIVNIVRF